MNKKLYVGNLPYNTTEAQVRQLFEQAGEITEVALITDRETGRPKGFGFVEMADAQEAAGAIKQLDQQEVEGRSVNVAVAQSRGGRPRRGANSW